MPRTFTVARFARGLLCFVQIGLAQVCFAQNDSGAAHQDAQPPPQLAPKQSRPADADAPSFTFKVTTRMVIVEVVVRDREDNPVRNLTAGELHVSERIGDSKEMRQKIASFRPVTDRDRVAGEKGVVLSWLHTTFCGLRGAYELSYYLSPESRKDGLHRITVTTSRSDLTLYFRPGYRIEADKATNVDPSELDDKRKSLQLQREEAIEAERKKHPERDLALIACYDALSTTNFELPLQKAQSKSGAAYRFVVPASYFAALPASERERPRQLDFSVCTFESSGRPLLHFEGTVDAGTNPEDQAAISSQGFAHTISFEPQPQAEPGQMSAPALSARLVVRDRSTGALGSGEMLLRPLSRDQFRSPIPEGQTNDIFGTKNPNTPLAICGDVYQLAPWTTSLPRFSELDAISPIYATSLGVYSRFFTAGIPGVSSRTEWFGVNYQAPFGVDRPGKYEFDLLSDDGAKVYIDDKLIVADDTLHSPQRSRGSIKLQNGAHDIRVSYFQGPRTEVALVLLVKPPGRGWRLFDTRDFPSPEVPSAKREKLKDPTD